MYAFNIEYDKTIRYYKFIMKIRIFILYRYNKVYNDYMYMNTYMIITT